MFIVRLLVIFLVLIHNSMASQCGLPDFEGIVCEKSSRVKNQSELDGYIENAKTLNPVSRNLIIDFDVASSSVLNIISPCKIVFKKFKTLSGENFCINGKNGVIFQNNYTLSANTVEVYSKKKIAIRHHAEINTKSLSLISDGEGLESRAHIRHSSTIKSENLTIKAMARSTLGHTSTYDISNNLSVDSELEFSSIWKNTTVNAKNISFTSSRKNRFSRGVSINSESILMSSPECSLKNLTVSSAGSGDCFVEGRPLARLTRSAKSIDAGGASVL